MNHRLTIRRIETAACACLALASLQSLALAGSPASSPDPLATFQFQGIQLSTPLAQFQRRFPSAIFDRKDANEKLGLTTYIVAPPALTVADGVSLDFLDGKLYAILILYYPARLNDQGGVDRFTMKVIETFGTPDDTEKADDHLRLIWRRADIQRRLELTVVSTCVGMRIIDTEAESRLNARKAKAADFGF